MAKEKTPRQTILPAALWLPLTSLKGVGPQRGEALSNLAQGTRLADLLFVLPLNFVDRSQASSLADTPHGTDGVFVVQVLSAVQPRHPRQPWVIHCQDDSGQHLQILYFRGQAAWLRKTFRPRVRLAIAGKVERNAVVPRIAHPKRVEPETAVAALRVPEPVYPLVKELSQHIVRESIAQALLFLPQEDSKASAKAPYGKWATHLQSEGGNEDLRAAEILGGLPSRFTALRGLHRPSDGQAALASLTADSPERRVLALDELFAHQLVLSQARRHNRTGGQSNAKTSSRLLRQGQKALPFTLTRAQTRALGEIVKDLASSDRMMRLLHGEVGSGKTAVAFLAALAVVETGGQVALMAPTEVLARQHYERLQPLATQLGVKIVLLIGGMTAKAQKQIHTSLADGTAQLAIGTHALYADSVVFKDLRFAVIDEQHRFGVRQRTALAAKAGKKHKADLLAMSATPIPRTLLMTSYGDLSVSTLDELPHGRPPVSTKVLPATRFDEVIARLAPRLKQGARVFWVCPRLLADDSAETDSQEEHKGLTSVEDRAKYLAECFPQQVGSIHGKMKPQEKSDAISAFAEGTRPLLVATTVVEVGVDVPTAEIMVVENAERFGLAQLHQLRGRIGRSGQTSSCLLLYRAPLGIHSKERLALIRKEHNGFVLAEQDLRLRGSGDLIGTRQHGDPEYRLVSIPEHGDLLPLARRLAEITIRHKIGQKEAAELCRLYQKESPS